MSDILEEALKVTVFCICHCFLFNCDHGPLVSATRARTVCPCSLPENWLVCGGTLAPPEKNRLRKGIHCDGPLITCRETPVDPESVVWVETGGQHNTTRDGLTVVAAVLQMTLHVLSTLKKLDMTHCKPTPRTRLPAPFISRLLISQSP